jgi:hypothetical protein
LPTGAAGAVEDQHGIGGFAGGVFLRLAEGVVVHAKFGKTFAGLEMKVVEDEVAFVGGWEL